MYGDPAGAVRGGHGARHRTEANYVIYTLLYAVITGLTYAGFSAFVLEAMGTGAAATKYNVFASLSNTPIWYMTRDRRMGARPLRTERDALWRGRVRSGRARSVRGGVLAGESFLEEPPGVEIVSEARPPMKPSIRGRRVPGRVREPRARRGAGSSPGQQLLVDRLRHSRALLLGGVVTGSPGDISSVY